MGTMPAYQPQPVVPQRRRLRPSVVVLLVLVVAAGALLWQRRAVLDYIQLANYQAPSQVAALSTDTTMTSYAQHVFYVNHPAIQDKSAFNTSCKSYGEQTIVLGCYHSDQRGIYVYAVNDPRLQGVEQVTAAHEMLHAVYDRLSSSERTNVDKMLVDYYNHDLHDQRILDTIASYKKTEPNDVVNEMHSVFGTEASNLPAPLEAYYKRYFTDRAKVVADANNYQAEFTSREQTVADDDQQLKAQKAQIEANQQELATQQAALQAQQAAMNAQKANGDTAGYNASVAPYNAAVNAYNGLVTQTSALIASYNQLVTQRNALALEVNQLAQAISSQPDTVPTR
jgi:hypothetical protein